MENTKLITQSFMDFDDLISSYEDKYCDLLVNIYKIDDMYWAIEKDGIGKQLTVLQELVDIIDCDIKKLFAAEEYLYKEMKNVMPDQSSVEALKSENESILILLNLLKGALDNKDKLKVQKDFIQAEMVALKDIIERNIHKKINVFLHEVRTMLQEDSRREMLLKHS